MADQARIDQAIKMAQESPHEGITVEFVMYAAARQDRSDPLRDEFTFSAAWRAWRTARKVGERDEQMRQLAEQLDAESSS